MHIKYLNIIRISSTRLIWWKSELGEKGNVQFWRKPAMPDNVLGQFGMHRAYLSGDSARAGGWWYVRGVAVMYIQI